MSAFKIDKIQQVRIEHFWRKIRINLILSEEAVMGIVGVIFTLLFGVLSYLSMGINALEENIMNVYWQILFAISAVGVSSKFIKFVDPKTKKKTLMKDLIRVLPVELMQLRFYRARKMIGPCLIITMMVILMKCGRSIGLFYSFHILEDVIYPLFFMFVLPVSMGFLLC